VKVVVSELAWPQLMEILSATAQVISDDRLWSDSIRFKDELATADALVIRNQTQVNRDLLAAAPRLRVIGRLGVGLDNIDLVACRERGIQVVFGRNANAVSVAEYVFAVMMAVSRRVTEATDSVKNGAWDRRLFTGTELAGRTLGIVGLGDIGGRLAKRAKAFGMRVLATDPVVTGSSFFVAEFEVEVCDLARLLAESDFVSLHVPLIPSTTGLIGPDQLQQMKPTAWVINTSRGGIIQEEPLYQALRKGWIGGAALDVRAVEPPVANDPLSTLDNVILTPHVAGLTDESQARTAVMVAEDVRRVLLDQRPLCGVL